MPDSNLIKLIRKTLLAALKNSVGVKIFQHVYVRRKSDGVEFDTVDGGGLSCALYVSGILAIFKLIDSAHSTVTTTLKEMGEAGWVAIESPRPGCVIVWPKLDGHEHIGFVLDETTCISNSLVKRSPQTHGFKLPDGREPEGYYWHPSLDQG